MATGRSGRSRAGREDRMPEVQPGRKQGMYGSIERHTGSDGMVRGEEYKLG